MPTVAVDRNSLVSVVNIFREIGIGQGSFEVRLWTGAIMELCGICLQWGPGTEPPVGKLDSKSSLKVETSDVQALIEVPLLLIICKLLSD